MRFSAPALVAAALMALGADARIEAVAVPPNIQIGSGFNIQLIGNNYIQTVEEIAAVVGVTPTSLPAGPVGPVLGSYYLGPEQSNKIGNTTKWVPVPNTQTPGPARVNVQLYQLYGAGRNGALTTFSVNVNFVNTPTSNSYINSGPGQSACS